MLGRSIGWVNKRAEDFRQRKRCIESELECVHGVLYLVLVADVLFGNHVHRTIEPSIALKLNEGGIEIVRSFSQFSQDGHLQW